MTNLPKNFVFQLGSLIALYVSVGAFITLVFSIINLAIPDAAASVWEWERSQSSLRLSLSLLAVFYPAYLGLTRSVNIARRTAAGTYITLTKWLVYLSLLIGGIIMLIDLVVVINAFLDGEITTRFLLKAGSLLLIIGAVFYYYLYDARGYWTMHEQHSVMYAAIATSIVIGMMVASFYHLETPTEARERKLDEQQVAEMQNMQMLIQAHYNSHESLPNDLSTLYSTGEPAAPNGREAYEYIIVDDYNYRLCATFAIDVSGVPQVTRPTPSKNNDWSHAAGRWCFDREVVADVTQDTPETLQIVE